MDHLNAYIKKLTTAHPGIKSIWLLGSRANNSYRPDSDWDLLVFANQQIFYELKRRNTFYDDKIDLLVVFNDDEFEKPWPDEKGAKHGSLKSWEWVETSPQHATYKSVKYKNEDDWFKGNMLVSQTLRALKVWPSSN